MKKNSKTKPKMENNQLESQLPRETLVPSPLADQNLVNKKVGEQWV